MLAEALRAAGAGSGRVVLVTGEPGIGKTALVTRFVRDPEARVLFGACDDLAIPRPLGPFRDLAGTASAPFAEALASGAAPADFHALLRQELERPPGPTILVIEDVHWADEATLDAITVLGRRISGLPALLLLTFRGGEAPPGHPLRTALGAIRAEDSLTLELGPLSQHAVARLAGDDCDDIYAATRGNPFYVTELVAARTASDLPPSVAHAVLGRASRVDESSRRLLELVSVVPSRVSASVLDAVMPGWTAAAVEPERRQLLEVDASYARFRHELARNAVRSSLPTALRRSLHGEILAALLAQDADPADIVHHAEAAGARDVVAEYARIAARRAAEVEVESRGVLALPARGGLRRAAPAPRAGGNARRARPLGVRGRADRRRDAGDRAGDRDLSGPGLCGSGRQVHQRSLPVPLGGGGRGRRPRKGPGGDHDPRAARGVSGARQGVQRALAARDAAGGRQLRARVGRASARARDPPRRRRHARPCARQHRERQGRRRPGPDPRAASRTRGRRRRGRPPRGDPSAEQSRLHAPLLGATGRGAPLRAAGRRLRRRARDSRHRGQLGDGRGRPAPSRRRVGRGRAHRPARARPGHHPRPGRRDAARRAGGSPRRRRCRRAGREGRVHCISHGRAPPDRACAGAPGRMGVDERGAGSDRAVRAADRRARCSAGALRRQGGRVGSRRRPGLPDRRRGVRAARRDAPAGLARRGRCVRPRRVDVRPRADALAPRRCGRARRGPPDCPRARRRAADATRDRAHARAGAPGSPAAARDDAREPGRADRPRARGAGAPSRRPHECRDRRAAGRLPRTAEHHVAAVLRKLGAPTRREAARRATELLEPSV